MNRRILLLCIAAQWIGSLGLGAEAGILDVTIPNGPNYSLAAFRWWLPSGVRVVRGVTVLVPGSNYDGRSQVDDAFWRAFAQRHDLALVGCFFTDRPHDNMSIEE